MSAGVAPSHSGALQPLSDQRLAGGLDEPLMELTFHALEVLIGKRPGSKSIDVLAQPRERTRIIAAPQRKSRTGFGSLPVLRKRGLRW